MLGYIYNAACGVAGYVPPSYWTMSTCLGSPGSLTPCLVVRLEPARSAATRADICWLSASLASACSMRARDSADTRTQAASRGHTADSEAVMASEDIAAGGRKVRNLTNLHNPSCVQRLGSSYLNNGHWESGMCVAEVYYSVT